MDKKGQFVYVSNLCYLNTSRRERQVDKKGQFVYVSNLCYLNIIRRDDFVTYYMHEAHVSLITLGCSARLVDKIGRFA